MPPDHQDLDWTSNRLLRALPTPDLESLRPELEQLACPRELMLTDVDTALDHIFFPDSGVVSAVSVYADGSIIETATIGREGCTGVQAALGARRSSVRLFVQIPGRATKMTRATFNRAMESTPAFSDLIGAYVRAFLDQVLVSVACNGAHSLRQRLARWLLMMRDRTDDDVLLITQDLLGEMLGVHRPSISHAVEGLESVGAIERGRRRVRIRDRLALIGEACECYQIVRARTASHLPQTYPQELG